MPLLTGIHTYVYGSKVKTLIKDTLNKGQPLYKGHSPRPQSHSANTFGPPNLSTKNKTVGLKVSFVQSPLLVVVREYVYSDGGSSLIVSFLSCHCG